MTEAVDTSPSPDKPLHADSHILFTSEVNNLARRFSRRAYILYAISYAFLLAGIVVLGVGGYYFFNANDLASNDLSDMQKRVSEYILKQSITTEKLTPLLKRVVANANSFDKSLQYSGLLAFNKGDDYSSYRVYDYGEALPEYFKSAATLAEFWTQALKDRQLPTSETRPAVTVVHLTISYDGSATEAEYFWAFRPSDLTAIIQSMRQDAYDEIEDFHSLMVERDNYRAEISTLTNQIRSAAIIRNSFRAPIAQINAKADSGYVWTLNLNRFATTALAAALMSVLFSVYKYNSQLATFYMSRSDILKISKKQNIDLSVLSAVFTPATTIDKPDSISIWKGFPFGAKETPG